MSTVLRVYGERFRVHEVLPTCPITPDSVSIKGQPRPNDPAQVSALTGFNLCVSSSDWAPFADQISESRAFIDEHGDWLHSLRQRSDIDTLTLDFGVLQSAERATLNLSISPAFAALLAATGITMAISVYPEAATEHYDQAAGLTPGWLRRQGPVRGQVYASAAWGQRWSCRG